MLKLFHKSVKLYTCIYIYIMKYMHIYKHYIYTCILSIYNETLIYMYIYVAIPGIHVLKGYIGYYGPLVPQPQCVG